MSKEMKESDVVAVGCAPLFIFAALPLLGAAACAYYGWAASIMWGWFLVPLGAPSLAWWQLAGIGLTVSALRTDVTADIKSDQKWYAVLLRAVLAPLFSLAMGWILLHAGGV